MIPILICSPVPALRAGLSALLAGDPELVIAEAAGSLEELTTSPGEDCVIVATAGALELPGADVPAGLALLLVAADPAEFGPNLWTALDGLELRAWGLIAPDASAEALRAAVRALAEGLLVFSPAAARQMALEAPSGALEASSTGLDASSEAPDVEDEVEAPLERLTEREVDVLRQMALGLTNKQIALALKISEHTVKFHVSSIYGKLRAANRTEAVRKGARRGWIPL